MDDGGLVAEASGGEARLASEVAEGLTADVAEFDALEVVPDALIRVEVRGVARQRLQLDATGTAVCQEVLDGLAAMDGRAVPDDQQLAGDVAEQMLEEAHDIRALERPLLHQHEQSIVRGDGTDDREMIATQWEREDRRLPAWGVGADRAREQVEARFIDPDDRPPLPVGPLFRAGHRSVSHASIAASLRWLARSIGFWTLQPAARRSLPT